MASGILTETAVFNMVLDHLAEESVLSPDDDKTVARWLKRNVPIERDVLLAMHPWNFAIKRAQLAADTATPAFEWNYQYRTPNDCLRVLPITNDGTRDGYPIPFTIEGDMILTDATAPLKVRYIRRVTNPGQWTAPFGTLLAAILAAKAAHWLTGKAGLAKALDEKIPNLLARTTLADALEGDPEPVESSDIINVR